VASQTLDVSSGNYKILPNQNPNEDQNFNYHDFENPLRQIQGEIYPKEIQYERVGITDENEQDISDDVTKISINGRQQKWKNFN
jgi:hypothetical protein